VQKTSSTVDQIHAAALQVSDRYQRQHHTSLLGCTRSARPLVLRRFQALVSRQSILGDLHDLEVLVEAICHAKAVKAMPSVVTYLQRRYRKLWKKWQQMEPLDEPTYAATLLAVLSPPREPPQEAH
jgi:CHAD domain-containing protein